VALAALKSNPRSPKAWMTEIRKHLPTPQYMQTPRLYGSRYYKGAAMF
jgi:hypothetical protein